MCAVGGRAFNLWGTICWGPWRWMLTHFSNIAWTSGQRMCSNYKMGGNSSNSSVRSKPCCQRVQLIAGWTSDCGGSVCFCLISVHSSWTKSPLYHTCGLVLHGEIVLMHCGFEKTYSITAHMEIMESMASCWWPSNPGTNRVILVNVAVRKSDSFPVGVCCF